MDALVGAWQIGALINSPPPQGALGGMRKRIHLAESTVCRVFLERLDSGSLM
jgi:hypothetical protein